MKRNSNQAKKYRYTNVEIESDYKETVNNQEQQAYH